MRSLEDDELITALDSIPHEVMREVTHRAIQEGRMPKPEGYDDAGEPVWKLEAIAEFFGLDVEEAKASIREFQEAHGMAETVDSASISRIH